ncbi:hypothetical protein B0T14DRAFT_566553 [Immersiella caudata]|uniref:Uncharacterized protein n=1 Tax=Immersiella caudata TaxID=314043 RepID=A0AA40C028_9PEZI|nr:hypothetical protein B0T14DRAFT_566553 [Immersiella caudata]
MEYEKSLPPYITTPSWKYLLVPTTDEEVRAELDRISLDATVAALKLRWATLYRSKGLPDEMLDWTARHDVMFLCRGHDFEGFDELEDHIKGDAHDDLRAQMPVREPRGAKPANQDQNCISALALALALNLTPDFGSPSPATTCKLEEIESD